MRMEQGSISIVIPVYNSEKSLPILIENLSSLIFSFAKEVEVLLINDCSKDSSWEIICSLAEKYRFVRGINLMRNFGQHNALLCGIRAAKNEIVITMDDDLQHPAEEIPKMIAKLEEGYDVVYGFPKKEQHGFSRNFASRITKWLLRNSMGAETASRVSAFRIFRTCVRDAFASFQGPFVSVDVLLTWGTTRFAAIPVRHEPRTIGQSQYSFRKLVTHAFNMITGFSTLPLQMASIVGFVFTLFGMAVLFYVIGRYVVLGYSVPGFPFLASIIAIFSGAQLFALGIIGEYLARIHFRMMDRPSYAIRSFVGENSGSK